MLLIGQKPVLALLAMTSAPDITILLNSKEPVLVVLALILDVGMVLSEWKGASMQSACYSFWTSRCDNMEGQEVSIDSKQSFNTWFCCQVELA